MSCSIDFINMINAGDADLDSWMREIVGCARVHDLQWSFDSITSAVTTCDRRQAMAVYQRLQLQVAALIQVSQQRTGFLGTRSSVDKEYEQRAQVANRMLQAYSQGLSTAR